MCCYLLPVKVGEWVDNISEKSKDISSAEDNSDSDAKGFGHSSPEA